MGKYIDSKSGREYVLYAENDIRRGRNDMIVFSKKHLFAAGIVFFLLFIMLGPSFAENQDEHEKDPVDISKCAVCSVRNGGEISEIPLHVQHARRIDNDGTITGDGTLYFMGLKRYMEYNSPDLPIFTLRDDFSIKTDFDVSLTEKSLKQSVFRQEQELVEVNVPKDWQKCQEGTYLIDICYNISRGEEYYKGDALFWLIVEY